jgi:hypothetical protein
MAADDSAMDVDRPRSHHNGSPRRMGIDFVTLGMFIIGLSIHFLSVSSVTVLNANLLSITQMKYTFLHHNHLFAIFPAAQVPSPR